MRCRTERRLSLAAAAKQVGLTRQTLGQWEAGKEPPDYLWPVAVALLGYDPAPAPETLGQLIRAVRRERGLSISDFGRAVKSDRETVAFWERDQAFPSTKHAARIIRYLSPARRRYARELCTAMRAHLNTARRVGRC